MAYLGSLGSSFTKSQRSWKYAKESERVRGPAFGNKLEVHYCISNWLLTRLAKITRPEMVAGCHWHALAPIKEATGISEGYKKHRWSTQCHLPLKNCILGGCF